MTSKTVVGLVQPWSCGWFLAKVNNMGQILYRSNVWHCNQIPSRSCCL